MGAEELELSAGSYRFLTLLTWPERTIVVERVDLRSRVRVQKGS